MGWKDIPDSQQSERLPDGVYESLQVKRVIRGSKDKGPFTAKDGSPQIMLIITDDQDREAPVMITLSAKAAWKLKQFLQAMDVDLDAMDRDGHDWNSFQYEDFASAQLVKRPFRGEITWKKSQNSTKDFADCVPYRQRGYQGEPGEQAGGDIPI